MKEKIWKWKEKTKEATQRESSQPWTAEQTASKKGENPLKKELNNPQGLDFADQAGSLMAQLSTIEMLPPKDMTNESTRLEQMTFGVKSESVRVIRTKVNITDLAM